MQVKTIQEAWKEANKIFPYDYELSTTKTEYPTYYSTSPEHPNNWISDLGNRLEINFESGESKNIWIESENENTNNLSYQIFIANSLKVQLLMN